MTVVHRGLGSQGLRKTRWLLLGGLVTGIAIWSTHFTAMLAFAPGVEIGFDVTRAAGSVLAAITVSSIGWLVAARAPGWPSAIGGGLVGMGLLLAHFIDMSAMRIAGRVTYDMDLVLAAMLGGPLLCALAGWWLRNRPDRGIPFVAAALLAAGVLFLHFVAMAAVGIYPDGRALASGHELGLGEVGGIVVGAASLILVIALGVLVHDQRIVRITAEERERLRQSEEHYRYSVELNPQIPWISDPSGQIVEISPRWSELVGSTPGSALGRGWLHHVHPDDVEPILAIWRKAIESGDDVLADGRYRLLLRDGSYRWFRARARPRIDAQGKIVKWYGNLEDIHDQVVAEQELRWAAHHDPLTQLPNRVLFGKRLETALTASRDDGSWVGLIVLDVDHFKELNDTMGHAAGDALLREIARRVIERVPAGATMARLGGDEFAILLTGLTAQHARLEIVHDLLAGTGAPFSIDGRSVEISLSAGAALAPRDGETPDALLKSADLALYAAKAEAPGSIRGFRPEMREAVERAHRMLGNARHALNKDRIVPFYQPKVCLRTGELTGFEALLRWRDEEQGLQAPMSIRAAFEDNDLAVQLTDRMLDRVLTDMIGWRDTGCTFGRVAINGSSGDFLRGRFAERILARLDAAGLPASMLELEVTETVLMGQFAERVEHALHTLSAAGVRIALDDFGTGYASLSHLKQFPVDAVKIDRSFVSRLTAAETEDSAIVGAVIDLAHNMGIDTVAEGVETALQAEYLIARGCDMVQGFLFGRPVAGARIPTLIRNWDSSAMLERCLRASWADALQQRPNVG
ncbi:bifunctional diguanylate cyclase/phosphodiesterase [Sphingomonas sp. M1-B02]|uniref:bifunctional diguanylate cyclase/phosphodiesterase n=1 Tax=Sphingomonas sp. M1-B02 TaxID=3114300 RepID=UPI002240A4FA|nr:EAL domain-containing protein [Sphingomonas sp. S6-11]UZK65139.1 EAL domain-containing protein [Sphingomonas sp. S6-11]